MASNNDNFFLKQQEPNKGCLLAMRDIILKLDEGITETLKYGMPCFCYNDKPLCYLWIDKKSKEPYFLMVEGTKLEHPDLESGDRARMKILRVNSNQDLPMETIELIMHQALDLYR